MDPSLGSAGFKHFRPIARERGGLRPLANREILTAPDRGDYSLEQYRSDVEGFYDRVDDVLSHAPVDPAAAFSAAMPPGSEEAATCGRRAPAEQAARMQRYRAWFHDRTRPPR